MEKFTGAAVQLPFDKINTIEGYKKILHYSIRKLKQKNVQLAVLPPYLFIFLQSLQWEQNLDFQQGFMYFAEQDTEYNNQLAKIHQEIARQYSIYLIPGTTIEKNRDGMFHSAWIISPQGDIISKQYQTHLAPWEQKLQLSRGKTLDPISLPFGRVGMLLSTDCWQPEAGRILSKMGGEIFIGLQGMQEKNNVWMQMSGLWQLVQHNKVCGIECCFDGMLLQTKLYGQSMLHIPRKQCQNKIGIVGRILSGSTGLVFGEFTQNKEHPSVYYAGYKQFSNLHI